MNPQIDNYLHEGCGRCPLGGTPQCKVHNWTEELGALRRIVLSCGLEEELKWGVPCYTFNHSNVIIISALKENCVISFFKGTSIHDPHRILKKPGENTQAARQIRFTDLQEIIDLEPVIKAYVYEAIEVEKAGLKVPMKKTAEFDVPEEFQVALDENPELKSAFEALTPGRQRGYLLHFGQPKQSKTRVKRIEKFYDHILNGKGLHDQ